ncbi:hypothetical protein ABZ896_16800 [Streptomyces sp. NPDC047072]|uniref:hypothetical protein n=1 Tax=Streptomyces sp. NPDC047072 TaxID=3154809 RepID=UPI0033E476EF
MTALPDSARITKSPLAPRREVVGAARALRRAALSALALLDGPHAEDFGRRAAEADERLVDLMAAITGEKREHQRRRIFSDPRRARGTLRCMLDLATALTAYDLDLADVRATFRRRSVPVEPRHFGERLVGAGFDLNTAVRFPSADGVHQAFTVADQVTRGCDPLVRGGLKALKYAVAPTAFTVINDVTAMLGRAEYQRHVRDLVRTLAELGAAAPTIEPIAPPLRTLDEESFLDEIEWRPEWETRSEVFEPWIDSVEVSPFPPDEVPDRRYPHRRSRRRPSAGAASVSEASEAGGPKGPPRAPRRPVDSRARSRQSHLRWRSTT